MLPQSAEQTGGVCMPRNEIPDMQVRIFRKFGARHHIAPKETLSVFEKFDISG